MYHINVSCILYLSHIYSHVYSCTYITHSLLTNTVYMVSWNMKMFHDDIHHAPFFWGCDLACIWCECARTWQTSPDRFPKISGSSTIHEPNWKMNVWLIYTYIYICIISRWTYCVDLMVKTYNMFAIWVSKKAEDTGKDHDTSSIRWFFKLHMMNLHPKVRWSMLEPFMPSMLRLPHPLHRLIHHAWFQPLIKLIFWTEMLDLCLKVFVVGKQMSVGFLICLDRHVDSIVFKRLNLCFFERRFHPSNSFCAWSFQVRQLLLRPSLARSVARRGGRFALTSLSHEEWFVVVGAFQLVTFRCLFS